MKIKKFKNEKGALIVESSVVFPVMFLVIFFLIFMGNAYWQKCRIEAIVESVTIQGAAYYGDPALKELEQNGKLPDMTTETNPYRAFFSDKDVGRYIDTELRARLGNVSSGLFTGMKPTSSIVNPEHYHNYFIYATCYTDLSYKVPIPIRLLGQTENFSLEVRAYAETAVMDVPEFIRNVNMAEDYIVQNGIDNKIAEAMQHVKDLFIKKDGGKGSTELVLIEDTQTTPIDTSKPEQITAGEPSAPTSDSDTPTGEVDAPIAIVYNSPIPSATDNPTPTINPTPTATNSKFLTAPATHNGILNIGAGDNPIEGAYNIDNKPNHDGVYKGDVTNLIGIADGSQSTVIMNNPYEYDPLSPEVSRVLQSGGTVEITGTMSNKYFKPYYNMSADELRAKGYEIVRKEPYNTTNPGKQSSGKEITGTPYIIILKKI